jgi:hypothetical protein
MEAKLSFNLPEEAAEFRLAQMGPELHGIVFNLRERYLRHEIERSDLTPEAQQALEGLQDWLTNELNNMNISFEGIP